MRIVLNGDPADVPEPLSIQGLLDHLGIDGRLVAVEYDRVVIRRARYAETMVAENAEVEIVAFVGGGAPSREVVCPRVWCLALSSVHRIAFTRWSPSVLHPSTFPCSC